LDGNRKIKELTVDDQLLEEPKEALVESIVVAFNKAIDDADHVNENEIKSTAMNMFPEMGK
jgi:DNA-binding protein YbaB